MFHLFAQSSRFPNYPVTVIARYYAITISNRNITVTIVVCQDFLSLDERSSSCMIETGGNYYASRIIDLPFYLVTHSKRKEDPP
jgi:hypothetical protein